MPIQFIKRFLQLESASGILLFMMAMIAMVWANSPLAGLHQQLISHSIFWINDGLMAIFFLVIGLELKRGFLEGEFSTASQVLLPSVAALGGMLIPALIYIVINHGNPVTIKGWATPVATDIAFALGVLSLFGKRIPVQLKLFLLALAIFDDIGAIIIIAVFYSHGLSVFWLNQSVLLVVLLYLLNHDAVRRLSVYLILGVCLWITLFKSGIHPTIAGVVLAMMIPGDRHHVQRSLLHQLEKTLHPWVAYLIMPLFALANAGFAFADIPADIFSSLVVWGIVLGLLVGKQTGVFLFSWLLIKSKWAVLPQNTSWLSLYAVALLCGIGFTMSLFLGTLSFQYETTNYLAEVRLGVIIGSVLSGLLGASVLYIARSYYVGKS
jgi:NhaA family Na+:H+ antiporter